jgi:hypothetical protein
VAGGGVQLLDEAAAQVVGAALRANSTLTFLSLLHVNLWHEPGAAVALLGALTAHRSLRELQLYSNQGAEPDRAIAGAALGALVAANAAALEKLNVYHCMLRDAGLGPLVDALPHNTHLCTLRCDGNGITEAFVRERLLPAVRANTSLRWLDAGESGAAKEVAALVHARAAAA